jgi:hypothetical protein
MITPAPLVDQHSNFAIQFFILSQSVACVGDLAAVAC